LLWTAGREALRRAAAGDRVAAALVDHLQHHAEGIVGRRSGCWRTTPPSIGTRPK
jgi:hypothetical protein